MSRGQKLVFCARPPLFCIVGFVVVAAMGTIPDKAAVDFKRLTLVSTGAAAARGRFMEGTSAVAEVGPPDTTVFDLGGCFFLPAARVSLVLHGCGTRGETGNGMDVGR